MQINHNPPCFENTAFGQKAVETMRIIKYNVMEVSDYVGRNEKNGGFAKA